MAKAVALIEAVPYENEDGFTEWAAKGDEFEVSDKDFKRLSALGAVAKPGSAAAEDDFDPATAEVSDALTRDQLAAVAASRDLEVTRSDGKSGDPTKADYLSALGA